MLLLPVSHAVFFFLFQTTSLLTTIYGPLFCDVCQLPVNLKHTWAWCNNHRYFACPVKVAVKIVVLKH